MKKIINILFSLLILSGFVACDDKEYNGLDIRGEVKIVSFTAAGVKQQSINEEQGSIELVFPSGTDLTRISPSITLSDGAEIATPANPYGPIDLSDIVVYTIINGNLYHDYKVIATHVDGQILSFDIDRYKGIINHKERTIVIRVPLDTDVTSLSPVVTITEGARLLSPTATRLDFTHPVQYTLEYLDETFTYTVTVEAGTISPVAFLGHAGNAGALTNMDEKTAYEWLAENFAACEYISFDDIKSGKDLTPFGVIWYHYESYENGGDPVLHRDAENETVIEALKAYRNQGGGLFLTSAGLALGTVLEVAKDNKMWNNAWGFDNDPFEMSDGNGIGWGMRTTREHEIFNGLRMATGETDRFYLISNGCNVKAHNVIWNFSDDWTGWNRDVARWESENGGKQLATFHWDDAKNERCVLTEYEREGEVGAVITCGSEVYDWYQEDGSPENQYRDNLEKLTFNILNYLSN